MKKKILILILVILILFGGIVICLKITDSNETNVVSEVSLDDILSGKSNSSWQSFKYDFVRDDGSINEMEIVGMNLKFGEEFLNVCITSEDDGLTSCEDLLFSYRDDAIEVYDGMIVHFFGKYKISYENEILTFSRYNNDKREFSYYFKAVV